MAVLLLFVDCIWKRAYRYCARRNVGLPERPNTKGDMMISLSACSLLWLPGSLWRWVIVLFKSHLDDLMSRWRGKAYHNDRVFVNQDAAISISLEVHSCGPSECNSLVLQRNVDTPAMEHNLVALATKDLVHDMVSRLIFVLVSDRLIPESFSPVGYSHVLSQCSMILWSGR